MDKTAVVTGNRGKFQQIFMNLISNAKDAVSEKHDKKVEIRISEEKGVLHLYVKDNGSGIPEEIRHKIFDPFFTTKEVNKGTGIGLSMVHNFIKEMSGKVSIESEHGVGTTFKIELPLVTNLQPQLEVNEGVASVKQLSGSILLVDDEEEIRQLLSEVLEDMGLKVQTATNGKEALDLYLKKPENYDLIISDMKMPVMDGASFLDTLRKNKKIKQPKFIFVTGGININFKEEGNSLFSQIDGYFFKPFNYDKVFEVISNCLNQKAA